MPLYRIPNNDTLAAEPTKVIMRVGVMGPEHQELEKGKEYTLPRQFAYELVHQNRALLAPNEDPKEHERQLEQARAREQEEAAGEGQSDRLRRRAKVS